MSGISSGLFKPFQEIRQFSCDTPDYIFVTLLIEMNLSFFFIFSCNLLLIQAFARSSRQRYFFAGRISQFRCQQYWFVRYARPSANWYASLLCGRPNDRWGYRRFRTNGNAFDADGFGIGDNAITGDYFLPGQEEERFLWDLRMLVGSNNFKTPATVPFRRDWAWKCEWSVEWNDFASTVDRFCFGTISFDASCQLRR